jgi:hypothetical protein
MFGGDLGDCGFVSGLTGTGSDISKLASLCTSTTGYVSGDVILPCQPEVLSAQKNASTLAADSEHAAMMCQSCSPGWQTNARADLPMCKFVVAP